MHQNNKSPHKSWARFVIKWIEEVFTNSPEGEKFIITQHISPGIQVEHKISLEWEEEYQQEYKRILQKYYRKVLVSLAGHIHTFRMALPLSFNGDFEKQYLHFNFGSMSPVFKNNPVYYFVKFEKEENSVALKDILVEEIDLHGLITRERSLKKDILGDLCSNMKGYNGIP